MPIEVNDVISIAVPSLFLVCSAHRQMHFLLLGLFSAPSPPHVDFKAYKQIHVITNIPGVTYTSKHSSLLASTTYTIQSTTYSCMPLAPLACSGSPPRCCKHQPRTKMDTVCAGTNSKRACITASYQKEIAAQLLNALIEDGTPE